MAKPTVLGSKIYPRIVFGLSVYQLFLKPITALKSHSFINYNIQICSFLPVTMVKNLKLDLCADNMVFCGILVEISRVGLSMFMYCNCLIQNFLI